MMVILTVELESERSRSGFVRRDPAIDPFDPALSARSPCTIHVRSFEQRATRYGPAIRSGAGFGV